MQHAYNYLITINRSQFNVSCVLHIQSSKKISGPQSWYRNNKLHCTASVTSDYLPVLALTLMTASKPVCLVILLLKSWSSLSASLAICIRVNSYKAIHVLSIPQQTQFYEWYNFKNTAIAKYLHKLLLFITTKIMYPKLRIIMELATSCTSTMAYCGSINV